MIAYMFSLRNGLRSSAHRWNQRKLSCCSGSSSKNMYAFSIYKHFRGARSAVCENAPVFFFFERENATV